MCRRFNVLIISIFIVCVLNGCVKTKLYEEYNENNKTVAVSILPQKDFVRGVGGDRINIVTMIPPGSSPATYMPSAKQMKQLSKADIYFAIGVPAEKTYIIPKLIDINQNIKLVNLFDKVAEVHDKRFIEVEESTDPHIWMSPKRVVVMVNEICQMLCEIDNDNAEYFQNNAKKYIDKLNLIDNDINTMFSKSQNKDFMIYHPSLGYFADDYGLNMIAIEQGGKKVSTKQLKNIIKNSQNSTINTIFYQKEFDSKQAKIIAREIGGNIREIDILSDNYIDNIRVIAEAIKSSME